MVKRHPAGVPFLRGEGPVLCTGLSEHVPSQSYGAERHSKMKGAGK